MPSQTHPPSPHPPYQHPSDTAQHNPLTFPDCPPAEFPPTGPVLVSTSSLERPFQTLSLADKDPSPSNPPYHPDQQYEAQPELETLSENGLMVQRNDHAVERDQGRQSVQTGLPSAPPSSLSHPSLPLDRPFLPHRTSSYSKRHASFDTPGEAPLPYMPSRAQQRPYHSPSSRATPPTSTGQDNEGSSPLGTKADTYSSYIQYPVAGSSSSSDSTGSSSANSSAPSSFHIGMDVSPDPTTSPYYMDTSEDPASQQPQPNRMGQRSASGSVHLFSRPFSSPDAARSPPVVDRIRSPSPVPASELSNRNSTASLPLPMLTPYHTLPSLPGNTIYEGREMATVANQPSPSMSQAGPSQPHRYHTPGYARSNSPPHYSPRESYSRSPSTDNSHRDHTPTTSSELSYPPPAPPTILAPPLPSLNESNAPHVPFLSHGQPSRDTYIAVETLAREYRLIVRLPGYRRDSITLSTRKRRILHLVADSWEPEGGHFERRISFGYDADLAQVRAEFDGELLRVIVPRRIAPMTYWSARD